MSEDRYRVLQDAITEARQAACCDGCYERNAHLDTLQAVLDRHKPSDANDVTWPNSKGMCRTCPDDWPCPDVLTVETALRNMGALDGGNK